MQGAFIFISATFAFFLYFENVKGGSSRTVPFGDVLPDELFTATEILTLVPKCLHAAYN